MTKLLAPLAAALAAACASAPVEAQECLGYGDGAVELKGRVYAFEAFAEEAEDISRVRRADYHALIIQIPFCVAGAGQPEQRNVGIVELEGRDLAPMVGRQVRVAGALTPSDGETPVKMSVRRIQAEK